MLADRVSVVQDKKNTVHATSALGSDKGSFFLTDDWTYNMIQVKGRLTQYSCIQR